ncbi:MAG: sugar kinase [Hyphomicrobiales bacterium]|nr:sugar kinase [Hyphomicrobiales bacterium]
MKALFIGQTYIDVTMLADEMPAGDDKAVANDYAVSFGGNAVTAAFACAKLGQVPDLIATVADDWLGRMFTDMALQYRIPLHDRKVARSSLSFIMPKDGKRAILRARDDDYLHPFPRLNINGCQALHIDGHQHEAAIHYADECRKNGVLTSLDGGSLRPSTHDLLPLIDVAIVAERLCEQMNMNSSQMLAFLKSRGCKIGGVTEGERGMLWYDEAGKEQRLPALPVESKLVIDTSGAGDVFHGAYMASYLTRPSDPWIEHFLFARAASAWKVQHLGNEAGLPTVANIAQMRARYETPDTLPSE